MAAIDDLYASLAQRQRPEEVAALVYQVIGEALTKEEQETLQRAARGAHSAGGWGFSSMPVEFQRPVGLASQVATARALFPTISAPANGECDDPASLQVYGGAAAGTIAKECGRSDFKGDRLNRERRGAAGLGELSKRQYNKRFRLLGRMEHKLATLEREIRKREYTLVSKSRLASRITRDDFLADADSASFIAYLTAQANLRSVFTNGPQQRAYDEVADMLFQRCLRAECANWWAIAHVHPDREVLRRLPDDQKGRFLATWFGLLTGIAGLLREVWEKSRFNRATMVVKRGDDSTTWNATAGAWNKARAAWIAVLNALDMDDVLDRFCPGKVLRLMAADVAAWHRSSGGGLEPDTKVWATLPAPWEVLDGAAECTRETVEAACKRCGVDPVEKGWTAPRTNCIVEAFRPTPELVHGVEVGHPGLAGLLRRMGVFSGKPLKVPT